MDRVLIRTPPELPGTSSEEEVVESDTLQMVLVAIIILAIIGAVAWPKFGATIKVPGAEANVTGEGRTSEPSAVDDVSQPTPGGSTVTQTAEGSLGAIQVGGDLTVGGGDARGGRPSAD